MKVITLRRTRRSATARVCSLAIGCALVQMISIAPTFAVLLSLDDPQHGTESITRDTETNLDWLDINLTTNRSIENINSQFGVAGEFAGFRYATQSEIIGLWTHAGIPHIDDDRTSNIEPAEALMALIGATAFQSDGSPVAVGIYDAGPNFSPVALLQSYIHTIVRGDVIISQTRVMSADLIHTYVLPTSVSPSYGSYLVRLVPEPSCIALVGISGIALLACRVGRLSKST